MTIARCHKVILLVCAAILLGAPRAALAACDQTLDVGAGIAAAVAAAPNGSTICLNSGDYGTVELSDIIRTGFVTLRSASGEGAQMSPQPENARFIRFQSMKLTAVMVGRCSESIEFVQSAFVPNAPGLFFNQGDGCTHPQSLLVDNVSFAGVDLMGFEGRLSTWGLNGLIVRNSFFGANGYGDGIQLGGGTNIVIGPNNIFDGISQDYCDAHGGAHCDALQIFGADPPLIIKGNWFKNSDSMIMAPDGSSSVLLEDNVFDSFGSAYAARLQFGSAVGNIIRHNTIVGSNSGFDSKPGNPASTNGLIENNLILDGVIDPSNGNGCTACSYLNNLFKRSSDAAFAPGIGSVIGNPNFVGGVHPSTWAGWALQPGSPGKNAGNDGKDLGANIGSGFARPAAPTGLHIVN